MDVVTDAATSAVRGGLSAAQVAAGELAKQANSVAQLASSKDPVAWLTGDDDDVEADFVEEDRPSPLVSVPLAAVQSWASVSHAGPVPQAYPGIGAPEAATDAAGQAAEAERRPREPPFTIDPGINAKVALWEGEPCSLEVDALLAPSAAGYSPGASLVFPKVLRYGGKDLRADLRHLDPCRSGEARLAKAYGLPCQRLLLTVGPKYKEKYPIAAQNTLNASYRECFQLMAEAELRTVAVPCTWYRQGYPPEEQANVALRTARRCLEKLRGAVDTVVFVAAGQQEADLYESLMPLYFPRVAEEAAAGARVLPDSCWTPWGEVAVEERKIRVSHALISGEDDDRDLLFSPTDADDRGFLNADANADERALQRLQGTMTEAETAEQARSACIRYLRRAREVRAEPECSRFVYRAGQDDRLRRHIIVLLGARLPSLGVRDGRTLPLFVKECELLQGEPFTLLYFNSCVSALDTSTLEVLQEMLAVINAKYRKSLDQIAVVHPGIWFRAAFRLGKLVNEDAANVWDDTIYF
ncbi:unnamed protein product, partial [Prorocentrum cordatum]